MRIRIHDEVFAGGLSPPLSFASSRYRRAWRARFRTLCYSSAHVTHHTISCRYYVRTRVLFRSTANTRPFFTRFSSVSFSFVSVSAPRRVFRRPPTQHRAAANRVAGPAKIRGGDTPVRAHQQVDALFSVLSRPTHRRHLLHIAILQVLTYESPLAKLGSL